MTIQGEQKGFEIIPSSKMHWHQSDKRKKVQVVAYTIILLRTGS